jgi:nitroimidazol reductase NimA-like FMN-containing flavoprotein (pyridoxamine 5'-phosphate oxidase superfamily)
VLDAGRVAHVGFEAGGVPYVVPLAYGRDADRVLVHGSTGSRAFRRLADGAPACLTVTLLDGLVLARSAFETSMRYRSAMVLGTFAPITDPAAKEAALACISEHSAPGRWADVRPPSSKELAATAVLTLPLDEWSVKISDSWPEDEPGDLGRPVWAGVVGFSTRVDPPQPAPDLRPGHEPPDYLSTLPAPGTCP